MGAIADWFFGTPSAPQSSINAPEVRSVAPYVSDEGTVHDGSDALNIPTRSDFIQTITEAQASSLIAVHRARSILATSVMQLSLDAYRADELIERPSLLKRPDPDMSLPAFLELTENSLTGNGNAFWRVFRDNQGRVTSVRVLDPKSVEPRLDLNGFVIGYHWRGQEWTKRDIAHLSINRTPGDARGKGPIQVAQAELRGALDVRDHAAVWFQEAGVPTGILKTDQELTEDSARRYREQWEKSQGGQRGTAILGRGLSYQPTYLSPEDAQWIAARQFDTTSVARLFGIPASLMLAAVEGSAQTYSNISQAWVEFQRFTLSRYTVEIEQAFSELLPRGTEVRFNLEALLRPDVVTRYLMHTQALQAGFLSVNEVRAIENLPPAPDGDFKTAEEKAQAFQDAQEAPGPGDTAEPEEASDE